MKLKIKALTQYKNFSTLSSLDAAKERIDLIKNFLHFNKNSDLLKIAKFHPEDFLVSSKRLFQQLGPRSLGINPTPLCNRNCLFCSSRQRNQINIKDKIEIKSNVLKKTLDDFHLIGGQGCVLVGGGESLLAYHGKINQIIANLPLHYGFNTNGVNLDKFLYPRLLDKISWISISIIGHNRKLYNLIGGLPKDNLQFYTLQKNLKGYLKLAKKAKENKVKFPYISAKILICRENYRFAAEIYNYLKKLGLDDIALRCVNNFEVGKTYRGRALKPQNIELTYYEKNKLKEILTSETNLKQEVIRNITRKKSGIRNFPIIPTVCWNIVLGLIVNIDTDGETYLCNPKLGLKDYSIGNINSDNLKNIWESEKHYNIVTKTFLDFKKGKCEISKCRHYRVNQTIELFLRGDISLKNRNYYEKEMSFFP